MTNDSYGSALHTPEYSAEWDFPASLLERVATEAPLDWYDSQRLLAEVVMSISPERDRRIFALRYGFTLSIPTWRGASPQTLKQIGHEFDVTPERIRQILMRCERRLRIHITEALRNRQFDNAALRLSAHLGNGISGAETRIGQELLSIANSWFPELPVLTHGLPLIASFVFRDGRIRDRAIKSARELSRRRLT